MRVHFGPDDEQLFHEARDDLAERFEATAEGKERGWIASMLLDFKWGYLDGRLDTWTADDLEEIILGHFPARVVVDPEDIHDVVPACAAFLRFLGREGILAGGEDAGRRVGDAAQRLAPAYQAAAMDPGLSGDGEAPVDDGRGRGGRHPRPRCLPGVDGGLQRPLPRGARGHPRSAPRRPRDDPAAAPG